MEQFLFRSPARYCLNKADYAYSLGGKLTDIIDRETDGNTDILQTPIGIEDYWLENVHLNIERPRRFVFIGRYEKRKGIDLLNNVIEKNYSGDFYFDFIGPIPEEKRVDFPNVYYHGAIYEENRIIKILNQGDVLFCPSYSEGMPTVILEAMSRGLAVVATDVGAVNCLVSSQTGWLIEPGDQELLDKTFKECINIGEEELIDKKRAAHQLIKEEYTWTNIAKINKQAILSAVEE
ncbi:glycosyltransferase family 4 protein [Aliifodinibius salicampi]|uniref:Glycosyltransferase family 4 protein n=2 Tax=Fodinibius salicampi TaxID=1920655 RepID=A0ABT3PV38_9BACT|nr:glycosyltransferase family 4 protein [Fodinibius salicampi]